MEKFSEKQKNLFEKITENLKRMVEKDLNFLKNHQDKKNKDIDFLFQEWKKITIENEIELKKIIQMYGWNSVFKTYQNLKNAWLITQHLNQNFDFQKTFLEHIKQIDLNKFNLENQLKVKEHIAMLEDRYLTNTEGFQIYGSQWGKDQKPVPIVKNIDDYSVGFLDPENKNDRMLINERRKGKFSKDIEKIENYAAINKNWKNSVNWAQEYKDVSQITEK